VQSSSRSSTWRQLSWGAGLGAVCLWCPRRLLHVGQLGLHSSRANRPAEADHGTVSLLHNYTKSASRRSQSQLQGLCF